MNEICFVESFEYAFKHMLDFPFENMRLLLSDTFALKHTSYGYALAIECTGSLVTVSGTSQTVYWCWLVLLVRCAR